MLASYVSPLPDKMDDAPVTVYIRMWMWCTRIDGLERPKKKRHHDSITIEPRPAGQRARLERDGLVGDTATSTEIDDGHSIELPLLPVCLCVCVRTFFHILTTRPQERSGPKSQLQLLRQISRHQKM